MQFLKEKSNKEKERVMRTDWQWIGSIGWHDEKPDKIPHWLRRRVANRGKHGSTEGYYKGKIFIYNTVYNFGENQGDGHLDYYRRLRHGKHLKVK
jgi:hypothetical protein